MGLIMLFQAFAFIFVIMVIAAIIIAAVTLAIAAAFFIAAKKSQGRKRTAFCIASAVFASPAAFIAEGIIMPYVESPIILALFTVGILALFIIGLKRRAKFASKILMCAPWILFGAWFFYYTLMTANLVEDSILTGSFVAVWVIITYGSAYLFYRSYRKEAA